MARSCTRTPAYMKNGSAVVTGRTVAFSIWFYALDTTGGMLINIGDSDGGGTRNNIYISLSTNTVDLIQFRGGAFLYRSTTATYSINTWHHAVGMIETGGKGYVSLDGNTIVSSAAYFGAAALSGLDTTAIGAFIEPNGTFSNYCNAHLSMGAIWSNTIPIADINALADGYTPLLIREDVLESYWPLIGRTSPEIDVVGGYNMTLSANPPAIADNPRIIYPGVAHYGLTIPAAPTASPYMTTSPGLWGPL